MLSLQPQAWCLTLCLFCLAANLQAQTNTNSLTEDNSEHTLIANYSLGQNNDFDYNYGESSNYLYGLGTLNTSQSNQPVNVAKEENYQSTSYNYVPDNQINAQEDSFGSFVDEILDTPNNNNQQPQYRVVPVATVEDIHGISSKEKLEGYNNGSIRENSGREDRPATRVVPVATVEDIHGISSRDRLEGFNNGSIRENSGREDRPATRVVPVATVEDIHGISSRDKLEGYNNGSIRENSEWEDRPATRVVPVATVEDVHEINRSESEAYQPYRSSNPVVRPSSVKKESYRERRDRYATRPAYPSIGENSNSNRQYDSNDSYTIEANPPKPKKRGFGDFIRRAFNIDEGSENREYRSERSSSGNGEQREYRSSRSSSSSSSKEYSRSSRPERETRENSNSDDSSKATRSSRNQ